MSTIPDVPSRDAIRASTCWLAWSTTAMCPLQYVLLRIWSAPNTFTVSRLQMSTVCDPTTAESALRWCGRALDCKVVMHDPLQSRILGVWLLLSKGVSYWYHHEATNLPTPQWLMTSDVCLISDSKYILSSSQGLPVAFSCWRDWTASNKNDLP